ncbi:hypothetical protein DFP72DRAFT_916445 [Ephemerocybe angulata]|uniref:F-box domain-containing protein n=1 Tax=Ephemerocybe angulata TaxID=980116 RepID=A0A8H6LY37_9AGAR|nr:hypothetical protein DFP72DRAFT_916445 [Tulosesus angulatus]
MNKCINTAELIPLICEHLEPRNAYAFALAKRSFLKPGLDVVWRNISSFKPFLACLPVGLWKAKRHDLHPYMKPNIADLERPLVLKDLERYLGYYAPRIREFDVSKWERKGDPILSVAFFQALQLVTLGKPGALAPHLTAFKWMGLPDLLPPFGGEESQKFLSFRSLFLGTSVLFASLDLQIQIEISSTYAVTKTLTRVRELFLDEYLGDRIDLVDDFIAASISSWTNLETLHLSYVSNGGIAHLASLPRLKTLNIESCRTLPSYSPGTYPEPSNIPVKVFPALEEAFIATGSIERAIGFVQQLAPMDTALRKLRLHTLLEASYADAQNLLRTIEIHCNRNALEAIVWGEGSNRILDDGCYEEGTSVDLDDMLDIDGLFEFHKLTHLEMRVKKLVRLTPEQAMQMSRSFPNMTHLQLSWDSFYNSFPPLIDHTHLLAILRGCPALATLKVRFDATRISGLESNPGFTSRVTQLHVGDSLICSPTRVAAFVTANFGALEKLSAYKNVEVYRVPSINYKRWKLVSKSVLGPGEDSDSEEESEEDY